MSAPDLQFDVSAMLDLNENEILNPEDKSSSNHCKSERERDSFMDQVLLREVGEDEGSLLWNQLVFLHPELFQQLPASDCERGLEKIAPKDLGGFIAREAIAALGNMAITQPPGVGQEERYHRQ